MSANETQVGGNHYKVGELQHWDLARIFKWDPFQYQITKYVMRWKDKHKSRAARLEDLKKARHFIDKYIEDCASWDDHRGEEPEEELFYHVVDPATRERNPDWLCEGWYGDGTHLYLHVATRAVYRAGSVTRAIELHAAAHPGPAYTNQG